MGVSAGQNVVCVVAGRCDLVRIASRTRPCFQRHGHPSVVDDDHNGVGEDANSDQPEARKPNVEYKESRDQRVADEMEGCIQRRGDESCERGEQDDLDRQREDNQKRATHPDFGQPRDFRTERPRDQEPGEQSDPDNHQPAALRVGLACVSAPAISVLSSAWSDGLSGRAPVGSNTSVSVAWIRSQIASSSRSVETDTMMPSVSSWITWRCPLRAAVFVCVRLRPG